MQITTELATVAMDIAETTESTVTRHIRKMSLNYGDAIEEGEDAVYERVAIVTYLVKKWITISSDIEFFKSLRNVSFLSVNASPILMTADVIPEFKRATKDKVVLQKILERGLSVFVKFSLQFYGDRQYKNVEPKMYKKVVNNLVIERKTPHVMLYYHHFDILDLGYWLGKHRQDIPTEYADNLHRQYVRKFRGLADERPDATVLLMESSKGITLEDYLARIKLGGTTEHLYAILFQVMYTLVCMDDIKLTHYDLHTGNIFLEELPTTKTIVYLVDSRTYVSLRCKYVAKIFDWEDSFHKSVNNKNEKSAMKRLPCVYIGACPQHNSKADLWRFFWYVTQDLGNSLPNDIAQWIQKGMNNTSSDPNVNLTLRKELAEKYPDFRVDYLCNVVEDDEGHYVCDGILEPSEYSFKNVQWYLNAFKDTVENRLEFRYGEISHLPEQWQPGTDFWNNWVYAIDPTLRNGLM